MSCEQWVLVGACCLVINGCGKTDSTRVRSEPAAEPNPDRLAPAPTERAAWQPDCSAANAPRPERDASPMCRIEGGVFWMGSREGEGLENERPRHQVEVGSFYLDQLEVTNAQIVRYLNAIGTHKGCPEEFSGNCFVVRDELDPKALVQLEDGRYWVEDEWLQHPYLSANWYGARNYCAWVGKRLPREAEWEYAARHDLRTGHDRIYPWGDEFDPTRANCRAPECEDGYDETAPVGALRDESPFGVRDMGGNADEFVADCFAPYKPCDGPCRLSDEQLDCGKRRVVRGGSFFAGGTVATRTALRLPITADSLSAGLRCARN